MFDPPRLATAKPSANPGGDEAVQPRHGVDSDDAESAIPERPVRFRGPVANAACVAAVSAAAYVWGTAAHNRQIEIGSGAAFVVAIVLIVIVLTRNAFRNE